jgi:hypothetical protein
MQSIWWTDGKATNNVRVRLYEVKLTPTRNTSVTVHPAERDDGLVSMATLYPLEAGDRPGRKSRRTLQSRPGGGQPYLRALGNRFQPGVPPTDDFGGPSGKGVPSATAELTTAVPVGPPRPSSITHASG